MLWICSFFIMIVYSCPCLLVMGVKRKSSSQEECQSNGTSVSALGEKKSKLRKGCSAKVICFGTCWGI